MQAYALQQALIKLGYAPEIIQYDYYKDHTVFGVPLASHPTLKRIIKTAVVEAVRYIPHKKRQEIFDDSIKNKLIVSKCYYKTYEELKNDPPQYDVYLTGSDQVFNAEISPQALPARLLSFVREGVKASYAASAGNTRIRGAVEDIVRNALASFDYLSVREEGLADYLESNFHLHAEHHIDPVFLLDKDEWTDFSKSIGYLPKDYILYYRVLPQKELNALTERISKELSLPVFVADGHDKFSNIINRKSFLSPEEWVYAINNASYVITNSFHGASFALNLNKRASIIIPPKGGERTRTLLQNCGLDHLINCDEVMPIDISNIYNYVLSYISEERIKSYFYLKNLL